MAFIDDPEFVIAHIRHSCVVTDDTGELSLYKLADIGNFNIFARQLLGHLNF